MSARRWIGPVGGGVAINVATELKSNPWAWVAVGVLTIAGITVGLASEQLVRTSRGDKSVVNRGTVISVAGGKSWIKVNALGPGAVVVIGAVVIVAVVAGLLVGRATTADVGTPTRAPTVESSSPRIEQADALDVRIDHLRAFSEGWFVVFPRDKAAHATEFARTDPLPGDEAGIDALFQRELASGAYIALAAGLPMRLVLRFHS